MMTVRTALVPTSSPAKVSPLRKLRLGTLLGSVAFSLVAGMATTGVATAEVAPAAGSAVVLSDTMTRTIAAGWGEAVVGGGYTVDKAAQFSVRGSYGVMNLRAGYSQVASLTDGTLADLTARVNIAVKAIAPGDAGTYTSVILRSQHGSAGYRATLRVAPGGKATLLIARIDGVNTNITYLTHEYPLADVRAGQFLTVVFSAQGRDLKAKAFPAGTTEPAWQIEYTDTSAGAVTKAGTVDLLGYTSTASGANEVWFDDISVTAPAAPPAAAAPVAAPAVAADPVTTAPVTTAPVTTAPVTTAPVTTAPVTTAPVTTAPVTTAPVTTDPVTTAPVTTAPVTTAPVTTAPVATAPVATAPVTTAPVATAPVTTAPVAKIGTVGGTGSVAVGSARYPVPAGAVVVSSGSSIQKAIDTAPSGSTIVIRGGSYHESVQVPSTKTITLQNYPGEAVWLDGAVNVSNFTKTGTTYTLSGWTRSFAADPTFTFGAQANTAAGWGFVNAAYPMAAHPDQVWIDGAAQLQVSSAAAVVPGTFYVDYTTDQLILGTNPVGHTVQASDLIQALQVRGANSVIRGIGIRHYSNSLPHMGAVTFEKSGIQAENLVVSDNSTTGIFTVGTGISLKNVTTVRNGLLGIHSNNSDSLVLTNVLSTTNNTEHFNSAPVSGGFKVSRSRGVTVQNSSFDNNYGVGVWVDESVYNSKIVNNTMVNNTKHGISLEISAKALVANNYIAKNGSTGIKVNDVNGARIINNTIIDNIGRPLNIVQDTRRATNVSTPGHDKRQGAYDPTVTWINSDIEVNNNILSGTKDKCLLCVEDYSRAFTAAQMVTSTEGNVYQRDTATTPAKVVYWSAKTTTTTFATITAFQNATGQATKALELTGTEAVTNGTPTTTVTTAATTIAKALPADIATLTGQTAGTKHLGIFR